MRLSKVGDRFVLDSMFAERHVPKRARFRWDPSSKRWWTDDAKKAAALFEYADDEIRAELEEYAEKRRVSLERSRASDADISIAAPPEHEYRAFQKAGIAYALGRNGTLIADEMGLGKTIQAIGVMNAESSVRRVLVICPASLKVNWMRELQEWLVRPLTIGIGDSKTYPETDVVVINYDVLHRHERALRAVEWDVLVIDECHYIKNPKARRSVQVYGKKKRGRGQNWEIEPIWAKRRLFLTGTPIVNRPAELFPILHAIDPVEWGSFWSFAHRYTNAHHNGYGWDFTGASNLDELQDRLRATCMVRRLKRDVLTELPAKRRQVVTLESEKAAAIIAREREAWSQYESRVESLEAEVDSLSKEDDRYKDAVARLRAAQQLAFSEMSAIRHETAVAKIPSIVEHLRVLLDDDPSYKVVLFAHHKDVLRAIANEFGSKAVLLTGDTPQKARQDAVDRFQTVESVQLFVGSIQAAGVGLTLTASAHVVFAELDWVPGNVTQAEDRCHRIGQSESVIVQHLVFDGSVDATIAKKIVAKQRIIDRALDDKTDEKPSFPSAARQKDRPSRKAEPVADELPAERVEAIHEALRIVSAACDGARAIDGQGFSKMDVAFGKSLAAAFVLTPKQAAAGLRLVRRYKRQIPADVLEKAGVE